MGTSGRTQSNWHANRDVMWGEFEVGAQRYSIAGAPQGLPLWSGGNPENGVADFLIWLPYSTLVDMFSRKFVVKVRRHRPAHARTALLRRSFPRTMDLAACLDEVKREVENSGSPRSAQRSY